MSRLLRHPLSWLLLMIAAHSCLTLLAALTRHYELKSSLMDNGVLMQVLWNFWQTGIPTSTIAPPYTGYNWLGFHFSPLILALTPLYMLWPGTTILQLTQSLCIASAALPVYLGARSLHSSPKAALFWAALYLFNPFILSGAIWDFHDVALATPLLAWAVYSLLQRCFLRMCLFLALLLLCKEHYGIAVAGCGIAWGWRWKEWGKAATLLFTGLGWCLFLIGWLMPYLSGIGEHTMFRTEGELGYRYIWLSKPWPEFWPYLLLILLHPFTLLYAAFLLAPLWGLPLHGLWLIFPAAADLAANVLSEEAMQKSVFSYHSMAAIPALTLAACAGLAHMCRRKHLSPPPFMAGIALTMIGISLTILTQNVWELERPRLTPAPEISEIQPLLHPDDVLSVQANIGNYFAGRPRVYPFPRHAEDATVILLHDALPYLEKDGPFGAPYGVVSWHEYMVSRHRLGMETRLPDYTKNGWKLYRLMPEPFTPEPFTSETQP